MKQSVVVREAIEADLEGLNELYNRYVLTSACTFDIAPITMERRRTWFDGFGGRYLLFVAHEGSHLVGYAYSGRFSERGAYDPSVSTSVYIDQAKRGKGIGTDLYRALFEALASEDVHRAYAGITMPNPASVRLHERFGFEQVAYFTEQGRKFDRYWDVAWFEKPFGGPGG